MNEGNQSKTRLSLSNKHHKVSIENNRDVIALAQDPMRRIDLIKAEGIANFTIKNYNKAIELFSNALSVLRLTEDSDKSRLQKIGLLNNRGNCYIKLNLYNEALNDFKEVLSLDEYNVKALYRIAFCYSRQGIFNLALKSIIKATKESKNISETESTLFEELSKHCINCMIEDSKKKKRDMILYTPDERATHTIEVSEHNPFDPTFKLNNTDKQITNKAPVKQQETLNKDNHTPKVSIKKEELKRFVYDSTINSAITVSGIRLAFSNLKDFESKLEYFLKIDPQRIPSIFKSDLDKELLLSIINILSYGLTNRELDQSLALSYLRSFTKTNRFSLVVKFIKKQGTIKSNI